MRSVILDAASLGSDVSLDSLQQAAPGLASFDFTAPDQIIPRLQGANIAIVNKTVIDAAVMAACPSLKMIAVTATGTNNIDLEVARQRGIRVCNVIRYGRASLVQHTFMLILTLAGNLHRYQQDVKVSLHCLLSNETRNLIDARELALMKPTALLINTARGGLVNESALADALTAGRIAGAGFDVLTREPLRLGQPRGPPTPDRPDR
jgi:lactate dehydrogenase-like 2-hydroxyacid dehydrogenase